MPAAFHQATAVALAPVGGAPFEVPSDGVPDGTALRWVAQLSPAWDVPSGVHGGVMLATALRAAGEALALAEVDPLSAPERRLRTVHASFLAPPAAHDLGVDTTVVRRGGTTAHVDVVVSTPSTTAALSARALYVRPRPSDDGWVDVPAPDVPGPDARSVAAAEQASVRHWPMAVPPLMSHFDLSTALGRLPWEHGWEPGAPARYARWSRYREAPTLADGTIDPLALLPIADLPGPSVWVRFGPDEALRALLSLEMTFDVLEPVRDEWILADFHARVLGDGYVLMDCELWSAGRLVALLRQTMLTRPLPGLGV